MLLVPASVLVLMVLGALAVDQAAVVAEQRALVGTAQAAAADAAAVGIDQNALRGSGALRYRADRIERTIRRALVGAAPGTTARWAVQGQVVSVWLTVPARLVFGPALDRSAPPTITAHATAVLVIRAP